MNWMTDQAKRGMNRRTYVLVAILVATLFWIHSLDERTDAMRRKATATAAGTPATALQTELASAGKREPSTPTPDGWGRDPFDQRFGRGAILEPAPRRGPATKAPTGLSLQGVMNGPVGRTALINGEIVREGDRIGSCEVLQIGARSVMLLDHGTVTTLTLKGDGS